MAKTRILLSLSEIGRKYNVSRQSVRNWVDRHEDFPAAVIIDGAKIRLASKKGGDDVFLVTDPGGRTKYFPADTVAAWVKAHPSLRSQKAAPAAKPKAKKKAKVEKAAPVKKAKAAKPAKKAVAVKKTKKKSKAK